MALAAISLKDKDAVSAAVQISYRLLDRKLMALATPEVTSERETSVRPLRSVKRRAP